MQRADGWALLAMTTFCSSKKASFTISLLTFVHTFYDECNEDVRREFLQNTQ